MEYPDLVPLLRIHPNTPLEVFLIKDLGKYAQCTISAQDYVTTYGVRDDFYVRLVDLPGNRLFRLVSTDPCRWKEVLTREDEYPQDYYWTNPGGYAVLEHQKHLFDCSTREVSPELEAAGEGSSFTEALTMEEQESVRKAAENLYKVAIDGQTSPKFFGPDVAAEIKPPQAPTKTFLQRAQEIAYGQRKIDYGPALENLQRIADLWSPILGVKVTAEQVCLAMIQVKVSRLCHTPEHEDSWVDIAGYVAVKDKINSGE